MSSHPILLIGGSGIVGRWTARFLREAHPDVPLLIGGRDLAKAERAASEIGNAQGVLVDLAAECTWPRRASCQCCCNFVDGRHDWRTPFQPYMRRAAHQHFSGHQRDGPRSSGLHTQARCRADCPRHRMAGGATTVCALEFAKDFGQIHDITLAGLLDEQDAGGPAAALDLERQTRTMPAALARRNGRFFWRIGDEATATFRAVDGTEMQALPSRPTT